MARVTGNVLGNLRGRLGNLSARTVNGQTILSARPESYTLSLSPEAIEARSKFGVTGSISKQIAEVDLLNSIWTKVKLSGMSVFDTIFKKNYPFSSAERPTADNIITPGGFSVPVQAATVLTDNLTVELLALTSAAVFSPEEVDLSARAIICYYDPINPDDLPYQFISLHSDVEAYNFAQTFEMNMGFNVNQQNIAAKYQHSILYFAVASKNADGKVVQYSATYTSSN